MAATAMAAGPDTRVVMLTHNYPRTAGDASGVFIQTLVKQIARRGFTVEVINLRGRWWDFYRIWHADVIHAHWWLPSGVLGAVFGMPWQRLVVTIHRADWELAIRWRPLRWLMRFVFWRAHSINFVSSWMLREFQALCPWADLGKCFVNPMPVDTDVFYPSSESKDTPPIVMFVGRLIPYKNVSGFLQAVRLAREQGGQFHPVVVGAGPEAELVLKDGVSHIGNQSPEELASLFRKASILIHAAKREGYGMVVAEAMACGVVPIAMLPGGVEDIIKDGVTGKLVNSVEEIASLLSAWVRQPLDSGFADLARQVRERAASDYADRIVDGFALAYRPKDPRSCLKSKQ